jgi:AcrR family transcriptional regulator
MLSVITSDSRNQMIRSAALLLRESGYRGTGFREIIKHSRAPRGSIYHHFR